ncbi:MAG: ribosomal-processing cysteine protease Prp [Firmicutes bacterium]|nr:ribosomal-processing cysteine protease Prp [Bacillota bacterium]
MVKVFVTRNGEGKIEGFRVEGHAGYGYRGNDIVCAGVSVLTQGALIGLEDYLGLQPEVIIEPGLLQCSLSPRPAGLGGQIDAILETMLLGLYGLATEYPQSVCILEEEVDCDA